MEIEFAMSKSGDRMRQGASEGSKGVGGCSKGVGGPLKQESAATAEAMEQLREVRHACLSLHKTMLDIEREAYESVHGRPSSGEMLRLVIEDEHLRGCTRSRN